MTKFRFWSKKRQNSKLSALQTAFYGRSFACMHFLALYSSFMTIHKTSPLGKIPDMPRHCFKINKQSSFWLLGCYKGDTFSRIWNITKNKTMKNIFLQIEYFHKNLNISQTNKYFKIWFWPHKKSWNLPWKTT